MKKIYTLILAVALCFALSQPAHAIDFKAQGEWVISFDYGQNGNFTGGNGQTGYNRGQDEVEAKQRMRFQLDAVASENLSGTVFFEIGDITWGHANSGGALGADGKTVEVRRAYIDWTVPHTELKLRMGLQGAIVPSYAMKKPQSLGDDFAAVAFSWKFHENVGISGFWGRPYNDNYTGRSGDGSQANFMDNVDAFVLTVPVTFDGVRVTPWGMYAAVGPNAFKSYDKDGDFKGNFNNATGVSGPWITRGMLPAWSNKGILNGENRPLNAYAQGIWAGVTGQITALEPWNIAWDFSYGNVSYDIGQFNRQGWMGALLVEYTFNSCTPGLVAWYASGDDDDLGNGSERLPTLSTGAMDNVFSNYALDGKVYIGRDAAMFNNLAGSFGIGLRVSNLSFLEDLKHTVRVNYIGGTNNSNILSKAHKRGYIPTPNNFDGSAYGVENMYLTDKDHAIEFGITNVYKIYDNLKVALDLGYISLSLDKSDDTWGRARINGRDDTVRDAWNVNMMFLYSF